MTIYVHKLLVIKVKKNLVYKNQGREPFHQKYKANESTSKHNRKKKKEENKQSTKNKKKVTKFVFLGIIHTLAITILCHSQFFLEEVDRPCANFLFV
jgi:hypothetical protein